MQHEQLYEVAHVEAESHRGVHLFMRHREHLLTETALQSAVVLHAMRVQVEKIPLAGPENVVRPARSAAQDAHTVQPRLQQHADIPQQALLSLLHSDPHQHDYQSRNYLLFPGEQLRLQLSPSLLQVQLTVRHHYSQVCLQSVLDVLHYVGHLARVVPLSSLLLINPLPLRHQFLYAVGPFSLSEGVQELSQKSKVVIMGCPCVNAQSVSKHHLGDSEHASPADVGGEVAVGEAEVVAVGEPEH